MTKEQFDEEALFHKSFTESAKRLNDLRNDRNLGDIGLGDPYWDAQNVHTSLYSSNQVVKE